MSVKKRIDWTSSKMLAYVFSTTAPIVLGLIGYVFGLIAYNEIFVMNFLAVAVGLYFGTSIVVGGGLKRLVTVFVVSFCAVIVFDLSFLFIQHFIAFCISLSVFLVMVRYSLIRDHDSGWFGASCAILMSIMFLLVIMLILAIVQLFLF